MFVTRIGHLLKQTFTSILIESGINAKPNHSKQIKNEKHKMNNSVEIAKL